MRKHYSRLFGGALTLWAICCFVGFASAAPDRVTGAEPAEGFGAKATGGLGAEEVVVSTFEELVKAINRSNVYIKVKGDIVATGNGIGKGSNITIDGGGAATLWGTARNAGQRMLELTGKNIVIKDIRLRNSGDNLSFKGPGENILVSHVTTSGSLDDGMSISYGTKNVTVQYCLFVGNTRSCFIKYGNPQNISLHHNWFKASYMRGPMISSARNVDVRNQLSEDWWTWGGPRFEKDSTGNCINSVFILTGVTPGKKDGADYTDGSATPTYSRGHLYRGCSGRPETFSSASEIPCAPVTTQPVEAVEATVRAKAGCLPRDEVDAAYIAMTRWPEMTTRKAVIFKIGPTDPMPGSPIEETLVPNDKLIAKQKSAGTKEPASDEPKGAEQKAKKTSEKKGGEI